MGSFFVLLPDRGSSEAQSSEIFQRALDTWALLKVSPPAVRRDSWVAAAIAPRRYGPAQSIASLPDGSFALSIGSWFHRAQACSDPRVLLQQYLSSGAQQLARDLSGFFIVVIGDARRREIIAITDLIGSCFACLRQLPGALAFSGSSLQLSLLAPSSLDLRSAQEFLNTGVIYDDRTLYQEVRKLPPASVCRFGIAEEITRYWSMETLDPEKYKSDSAADALWAEICAAAKTVGSHANNIVSDLTGGYDSRILTAAYSGAHVPVHTTVSGTPGSADVLVSQALAQHVGLPHQWIPTRQDAYTAEEIEAAFQLTDGEYDVFDYSRILRTHRQLSAKFDMSTNGSFGEVARGYWWELLVPRTGERTPLDCSKLVRLRFAPGACKLPVPGAPDLTDELTDVLERAISDLKWVPNTLQMDAAYLRLRMQRWQGRIASSTNRLWPCLSPLMTRGVLEVMLQSRPAERKRSYLVRNMLARHAPKFAQFPLEHRYPAAPITLANAHRFWPIVPFYSRRVTAKLSRLAGIKHDVPLCCGPATEFLRSEAAEPLLKLDKVRDAGVFDQSALPAGDALYRLLTVEYTLGRRISLACELARRLNAPAHQL